MSGQPYKKRTDVEKFRNQYVDALNLRGQLDKTVEQAVKNYKETGALPAVSQMKDNRTTADILADTEKLKIDVAGSLAKIADLQFGNAVVQRIISSPLNQDNSLLIFTAQRINDIVKKLGDLYAYGIKGDSNDVQQLVNFIAAMYSDKNYLASSTKDFIQNYTSRNIGGFTTQGGHNQFAEVLRLLSSVKSFINSYTVKLNDNPRPGMNIVVEPIIELNRLIDVLSQVIPTTPNVINMIDAILGRWIEYGRFNDEATRSLITYKDFISSGIPAVSQISLAFKKIEAYSKNQNFESLRQALLNMMSVLMPSEEWNIDRLMQLVERIDFRDIENAYHEIGNEPPVPQPAPQPAPGPNIGGVPEDNASGFSDNSSRFTEDNASNQSYSDVSNQSADIPPRRLDDVYRETLDNLTPQQLDEVYTRIQHYAYNPFVSDVDYKPILNYIKNMLDNEGVGSWQELGAQRKRVILSTALQNNYYILGSLGIHGLGIHHKPKRGRGRPKGSGIRKKYSEVLANSIREGGIEPDRRFVKFGRYLINNKKLNDGILAVKCLSGNGIAEFPSQRVSNNLRKVVKTMIGGGNPTFSDLEALSEPERIYLHKLASKADIVDKFNIPTPSKTKYEQDIHDFEVMKGEIMSGNDSKELVKKFKLHILKLSKLGALPKSEVQDILETLVELGY